MPVKIRLKPGPVILLDNRYKSIASSHGSRDTKAFDIDEKHQEKMG
jgi:hypothetical protein